MAVGFKTCHGKDIAMTRSTRGFALALVGLLLTVVAACGDGGESRLLISDAWARASAEGATTGAVYLSIRNSGPGDDRLISVETMRADRAMPHGQEMKGDTHRMVALDAISLPAGQEVRLEPGAMHLMLMGLKSPLREGETLTLRLRFAKATEVELVVPVLNPGTAGPLSEEME